MKVLLLVIITISFFFVPTLVRKWRNIPVLIAVTVAAAVNTNYYLSFDYPVDMGIFIFGMDALVGFIYIYSLIIVAFESSPKRAYELAISSVAAIVVHDPSGRSMLITSFPIESTIRRLSFT